MLAALFATGLLCYLLICCWFAYEDVKAEAEYQSTLDELWDEDDALDDEVAA